MLQIIINVIFVLTYALPVIGCLIYLVYSISDDLDNGHEIRKRDVAIYVSSSFCPILNVVMLTNFWGMR